MAETRLRQAIRRRGPRVAIALLAATVFCLAYLDHVSYEISDPHLSLLVSQAILEEGTIKLDAYRDRAEPPLASYPPSGPLIQQNGHTYYYFPLGPSILSVPFVAIANLAGLDMTRMADNHKLQDLLSAGLCAASVFLLYGVCRCYGAPGASLAITAISILGSGLISTMGTALWNIDWAVIWTTLALMLIARREEGLADSAHPFVVGICLFAAYLCRASSAALILPVLVYLLWRDRRGFARTAATAALLLAAYLGFSWIEYGSPLSQYYSVGRFAAYSVPIWVATYAHLFSASRGLLVYSPFFIVTLIGCIWDFRRLWRKGTFWLCAIWLSLHLFASSRSTRWWGGHTFGPRILTEALPALVLLTAMVWSLARSDGSRRRHRLAGALYVLLGVAAIWINSYQGLFHTETAAWNGGSMAPDVDSHPEYLLDWRYPQFAATQEDLCDRNREYQIAALSTNPARLTRYPLGDELRYTSGPKDPFGADREAYLEPFQPSRWFDELGRAWDTGDQVAQQLSDIPSGPVNAGTEVALFMGWSEPEAGFRWSQCETASIGFGIGSAEPGATYVLEVSSGSYGPQSIQVRLNGTLIGQMGFPGPGKPARTLGLAFPGALLRQDHYNEVAFTIPAASAPSPRDRRMLGLSFVALRIYPQE